MKKFVSGQDPAAGEATSEASLPLQSGSQWRSIEKVDRALEIVALSPAWQNGSRPIVLRWFKYNGLEAWRDWDGDPHWPTHYLWPLPSQPEREK